MGKSRATGVMCLARETNEPRQPKQHLSTNHLLSAQYDPWCYVTDRKMFMGQRLTWRKTGFSTFILQWECNFNSLQLFLHVSEYFSIHFFAVPRKDSPFTLAWQCAKIFCELCVIHIFSDIRMQVRRTIAQSLFSTKFGLPSWPFKVMNEKATVKRSWDHLFDFLPPWSYTLKWPSSNSQVGLNNNDTSWTHSLGCCILNS